MEAGLQEITVGILANHAMRRKSIMRRYLHPSVDGLREAVERVTAWMLAKAGVVPGDQREVG